MESHLAALNDWFCAYGMKLNEAKIQLIVHGTKRSLRDVQPVSIRLGSSVICESRTVKNLGFTMDRYLTFEDHINHLVAKCTELLISFCHSKHIFLPGQSSMLLMDLFLARSGTAFPYMDAVPKRSYIAYRNSSTSVLVSLVASVRTITFPTYLASLGGCVLSILLPIIDCAW